MVQLGGTGQDVAARGVAIVTSIHPDFDARIWRHARLIASLGVRCDLICPWNVADGTVLEGVHIHPFRPATSRLSRIWAVPIGVLRQLAPLLLRSDVIHFHDIDLVPLMLPLALFKPVVYDVHENYAEEMLVRYWIPKRLRRLMYHAVRSLHWLAAKVIRNIVAVVPDQIAEFESRGARVELICNYAARELADQCEAGIANRPPTVVCTASQYPENGTWVLLDIAEGVQRYDPKIKFLVVDRFASPQFREQVMQAIQTRSLNNIEFAPNLPPNQIMRHLNRGTIGLIPSPRVAKQLKALPTKLFEYMAAGLPVVASDLPHNVTVMNEVECGILVQPEDSETFVRAILALVEDGDRARRCGETGRTSFLNRYNWETYGSAFVRLYARARGEAGAETTAPAAALQQKPAARAAATALQQKAAVGAVAAGKPS